MGKRLLSTDFQEIVIRSFVLPKSDWYNYYLNLIELNYNYNRDIVEKIEQVINQWIDLYKSKVYGGIVPLKNEQGEIEFVDRNQIFGVDEHGNKTKIDIEKTNYSFQIKIDGLIQPVGMNRDFFDEQLRNLDIIKSAISLKNDLINFENTLPESLKKHLIKDPIPEGFDYYDLKNRVDLINQIPELLKQYKVILKNINENTDIEKPRKPTINQPEKFKNSIIFKNGETIKKIHSELKGYFPNSERELLNLFEGEQVLEKLYFPHNQNKLVEVFRRLKYNGFILSNDTEIKKWICSNFMFKKQNFEEPQNFNENSVWDILSKGRGEPAKKERICIVEWLPYKGKNQLDREKESEKL